MTKKRAALGRGLGALLGDSPVQSKSPKDGTTESKVEAGINEVDIANVEVNPFQPRSNFNKEALNELAESIKTQGIIQPITVRKLNADSYQLISGERRLQASKIAGLKKIPAYVRTADDQQMLEMALIENIQREDLNSIEIALSYQRLMAECDLKQEELGDRVGKNRSTVNNYLRLLKLPPDIQAGVRDGKISMGHARALVNIESVDLQLEIFQEIINKELSVRQTESLVRNIGDKTESTKQPTSSGLNYEYQKLQDSLSSHFGTKIALKANNQNKGEIKIPFNSSDDLNRILEILDL
ncbi:MAG: ParB/RepB/Spo0J family partition protein [Cyclobacteriaceae bacterium]